MRKSISLILALAIILSCIFVPTVSAAGVLWEETFNTDSMINDGSNGPGWPSFIYGNLPEGLANASNGDSIYVKDGKLVFEAVNTARNSETVLAIQLSGTWKYDRFTYEFDLEVENIDYGYTGCFGAIYSRADNYTQAVRYSMRDGQIKFGVGQNWYELTESTPVSIRMDVDMVNQKISWYADDELIEKNVPFNAKITSMDRFQLWMDSPSTQTMKLKFDNMRMSTEEESSGGEIAGNPYNWAPTINQQTVESIKEAVALKVNVPYAFVRNEKKFISEDDHTIVPLLKNDRTFLPVRFLAESFGAMVQWDEATQTATVETDTKLIKLTVGENTMTVNGEAVALDSAVFKKNDRTYLPMRAIAEALDKKVFWDDRGMIVVSNTEDVFIGDTAEYQKNHLYNWFAKGVDWETAGKGASIFVSPFGNDETGDGTVCRPYRTIEKAQIRARELKNTVNGVTVYLRGGTYKITKPLKFTEEDSGTAENPVIYRAYKNEEPIVTVATEIPVSDLKPVTDEEIRARLVPGFEDDVRVADLTQYGITELPEVTAEVLGNSSVVKGLVDVYIDGVKGTPARWPNYGYFTSGEVVNPGMNADDGIKSGFSFRYNDARPARWGKAKDMLLFGIPVYEYATGTFAAWVDTEERTINTDVPYRWHIVNNKPYYAYNLLEEIDVQGEYYIDKENKKLYIMPMDGMEKVEVAEADTTLLDINGASEIYFRDITFSGTSGDGIVLKDTSDIMILGCDINNIGNYGITGENVWNTAIEGCDIHDIAFIGISIRGGDAKTLKNSGNYIENCNIYRVGVNDLYSQGVELYGMGNRVSNCAMHDLPSSAIRNFENDTLIEYNDVYNYLKNAKDMGAIYRTGSNVHQRGQTIRHNELHFVNGNPELTHASGSVRMPVGGIYIDMSACNDVIYGNVFYDFYPEATSDVRAIFINGGRDFDVYNNVFAGNLATMTINNTGAANTEGTMHAGYIDTWGYDYLAEPHKTYYAEAAALTKDDVVLNRAFNNTVYNNLLVDGATIGFGQYSMLYDKHHNINYNGDPGFEDMTNGSFNLSPDSVVYEDVPGFENIQSDMMGTYAGEYRDEQISIGTFLPKFPSNNATNVQLTGNMFSWTYAANADKYRLIVADDPDFTNVLIDEEIKGHRTLQPFAYWEDLSALSYGENTYYWKVIAKSVNHELKDHEIGPFKFTTAKSETIVTDDMDNMIAYGESMLAKAEEGTAAGQYLEGSKKALENAIKTAKGYYGKEMLQSEFDEKSAVLLAALYKFEDSEVRPAPKTTNISEWLSDKNGWWDTGTVEKYSYSYNFPIGHWSGNTLTMNSRLTLSTMGYIRRQQGYDEIIKANMAFHFGGEAGVTHQVAMMVNQFDLGNKFTPMTQNSAYLIKISGSGSASVTKYKNGKDCGVIATAPAGTIKDGVAYEMEFGVVKEAGGTRVIWRVDGTDIANWLDTNDPIKTPGYLMFIDGGPAANFLSDTDDIKIVIK